MCAPWFKAGLVNLLSKYLSSLGLDGSLMLKMTDCSLLWHQVRSEGSNPLWKEGLEMQQVLQPSPLKGLHKRYTNLRDTPSL